VYGLRNYDALTLREVLAELRTLGASQDSAPEECQGQTLSRKMTLKFRTVAS
jgi:hypothetical protein